MPLMEGECRSVVAETDRPGSYAVTWRTQDGAVAAGKLVLDSTALRLESGAPRGRRSALTLRYEDLAAVEMARRPEERILDRPTALVTRAERPLLALAAVDGPGALHELVERLADAIASAARG